MMWSNCRLPDFNFRGIPEKKKHLEITATLNKVTLLSQAQSICTVDRNEVIWPECSPVPHYVSTNEADERSGVDIWYWVGIWQLIGWKYQYEVHEISVQQGRPSLGCKQQQQHKSIRQIAKTLRYGKISGLLHS